MFEGNRPGKSATRGGGRDKGVRQVSSVLNSSTSTRFDESEERDVHSNDVSSDLSSSSNKIQIWPDGDGVIQSKLYEPWPTWKQVPIEVRDMWNGEFKKRYHWLPEHEHQMRKNFESCGMNRLKGMFCQTRKKLDICPLWLSPEVWSELLVYWKSEEFKARSAQAKENRASEDGIGSSLHTGGSIPTSEHKRRLEKLGQDVSAVELFMYTHQKKDKSWVDSKSFQAYEKFTMKWKEVTSSESTSNSGDVPKISETDVWISENVTKKGHIYGLGSEGAKYRCTSSSAQSKRSNVQVVDTPEFKKMEEQMALVLQEKEALERRVVELEKERLEKEEMARKIVELEQKGKQSEKRMNKKIKKMMKMLKMPAKSDAFSQSSLAPQTGHHSTSELE